MINLVPNFGGYRLAMTTEYKLSESIQVYKGLIAKIMLHLNLAFTQKIIDSTGCEHTLIINKRSLSHYVWRYNRFKDLTPTMKDQSMASYYKASHSFFNSQYFKCKSFTNETCYQLNLRSVFKEKPKNLGDFIEQVHEQAPLKGLFYKIQKEGKTVGYLLGTMHLGNELFSGLNPKILKAISKSQIIAGEEPIDQIGKKKFVPKKEIEKKYALFSKFLLHAMKKANLSFHFGIEDCILTSSRNSLSKKELVGLETQEEKEDNFNLFLEENNTKISSHDLTISLRYLLSGDEGALLKANRQTKKTNPKNFQSVIERNYKMVERSESHFEKNRTFVAVGAMHLVGEEGMVNLYQAKGYTLKRVA